MPDPRATTGPRTGRAADQAPEERATPHASVVRRAMNRFAAVVVLVIHAGFAYLVFRGLRYLRRWIHG